MNPADIDQPDTGGEAHDFISDHATENPPTAQASFSPQESITVVKVFSIVQDAPDSHGNCLA